ncbi:MAG: YihY/virulence factor BrkB family protein [Gemmatimonadaceae bacterium]|nr:YihY/virulence factor BrkB family protein [Gemmatimonadaceae bacterium]
MSRRKRTFPLRLGWMLRDYSRRVWDNSAEDNIFFLAGGIAFNLLLAIVPFFLLLAGGLGYFLEHTPEVRAREIATLVATLLPMESTDASQPVVRLLMQILESRGTVQLVSAIGFVWFSTRLFGSVRSVLASIFDIETDRGIIAGKIFDIKVTIVATVLLVGYVVLSAYLALATTQGSTLLVELGLRRDVMGDVEYTIGRIVAFTSIAILFFSLYKFLPKRKIRWQMALVAATFSSVMFEIAKYAFGILIVSFSPQTMYTGTVAAAVITVIWVYYGALIFILGGEVGQVFELRRVRKLQREVFED